MNLKNTLITHLKNLPGRKTNRRLIAFFADDFGSVRVKDKNAYNTLLEAGIAVDKTRYGYDTLCNAEDLQMLFEVLTSVKDKNGNHACFTPFAIVANPDFEKIKESGFTGYYREPFTKTLERLGAGYVGTYGLWKQGISEGIFVPEYHGTEHLNVRKFMKTLQNGRKSTLLAFDNECICTPKFPDEMPLNHDTATFDIDDSSENEILKNDLKVGLDMFEKLFGYRSTQFTPGASIYSPDLQPTLRECGIDVIHVERYKAYPLGDGRFEKQFLYNGKMSKNGLRFLVRNCAFEVFSDNCSRNVNVVANTLNNIEASFRMHAPALISTHRVNFAGSIEKSHRNTSLEQLEILLKEIIRRWPDVEFVSGKQLAHIMF